MEISTLESNGKMAVIPHPPIIEKAAVARLVLPTDRASEVTESLDELRQLARSAGADVVLEFTQHRDKPDPGTYFGRGKLDDMRPALQEKEVELVVFDADLTGTQATKLEKVLDCKVVDRTQLILDIFAQRAQTREGKYQVELAQLQYLLPRLAGRGSVMRQQGGIGIRGPGEQKLEVDRRIIRKRIDRLREALEDVRRTRAVQRKQRVRNTVGAVALVGYTNAGKSSLLNALTEANAGVEDKLFATLDPLVRRCALPSGREILVADTVGFVRKLPHTLVAAFRATLEEVNEADLLLMVVDASHPAMEDHMRAVRSVIEEIGASDLPLLTVYNKIDCVAGDAVQCLLAGRDPSVAVSAKTGAGLDTLLAAVDEALATSRRCVKLRIPQHRAEAVARVHRTGRVLSERYEGNDVLIEAELAPESQGKLAEFIA